MKKLNQGKRVSLESVLPEWIKTEKERRKAYDLN